MQPRLEQNLRRRPARSMPPQSRTRCCSHGGFTIIELLVVITVIAVLISLLLPALAQSRRTALVIQCMNNQKSLGNGIFAYANDHKDQIPYGPQANPISIADFYVVDGMVTSQFALLDQGKPVGLGLLLKHYINNQPAILFCPDSDQPFNAEKEIKRVGITQAVGGYFYRHGSNTMDSLINKPPETWDDHTDLHNLGNNRNGQRISALVLDQNFLINPPLPAFNVIVRTNHEMRRSNVLYADGRVTTLDNSEGRYTANVGGLMQEGPSRILAAFENADQP